MSFKNNVKNLNSFLSDYGFKLYPECSGKYKSWVKELDDEHLVYIVWSIKRVSKHAI